MARPQGEPQDRRRGFLPRAVLGAGAYAGVQAVLFSNPPHAASVPLENPGWFLNSGPGVLAVVATLSLAGALSVLFRSATFTLAWLPVAAGAIVAMTATYVWLGGGNLFPIVIAVGAVCIGGAAFLGAGAAVVARRALGGSDARTL